MDDILAKVHEAGLTLKALRHRLRVLDDAPARRVRLRRRRVHVRAAVVHGYLRQDVLHRVLGRRRRGAQMGTFDIGHPDAMDFIRAKREAGRLRQFNLSLLVTDEFMQAVKANGTGRSRFRSRSAKRKARMNDAAKYVWREWPTTRGYVDERIGPGLLQGLQDAAGAPHVGRDHVLHLRLRRAGLRADRSRQRDEQQLVVREHPRHQSPAASSRCRRTARACSARSISRASSSIRSPTTRASTGRSSARSSRCSRACSTTSSRSTACRSASSATRSCASAATAWASSASARPSPCSA